MWAISVPILVFLGLSVLDLGPMYATDRRQTDVRRQTKASLNASALWGRRHNRLTGVVIHFRYYKKLLSFGLQPPMHRSGSS